MENIRKELKEIRALKRILQIGNRVLAIGLIYVWTIVGLYTFLSYCLSHSPLYGG